MKISQYHLSISFIALSAMMLLFSSHLVSAQEVVPTRDIGFYPGNPNEYYAPRGMSHSVPTPTLTSTPQLVASRPIFELTHL